MSDDSVGLVRVEINDETYAQVYLHSLNYSPVTLTSIVSASKRPSQLDLIEMVARTSAEIRLMQLNDGSILFRSVDVSQQGTYLCSRPTSRQWSKRVRLNVATRQFRQAQSISQFSTLLQPLVILFVVVCLFFVIVGMLLKYLCEPRCPKPVDQRQQKRINIADNSTNYPVITTHRY